MQNIDERFDLKYVTRSSKIKIVLNYYRGHYTKVLSECERILVILMVKKVGLAQPGKNLFN